MDYINVKIPKPMGDEIDKVLEEGHYGSRAELVKEAIRGKLKELRAERR